MHSPSAAFAPQGMFQSQRNFRSFVKTPKTLLKANSQFMSTHLSCLDCRHLKEDKYYSYYLDKSTWRRTFAHWDEKRQHGARRPWTGADNRNKCLITFWWGCLDSGSRPCELHFSLSNNGFASLATPEKVDNFSERRLIPLISLLRQTKSSCVFSSQWKWVSQHPARLCYHLHAEVSVWTHTFLAVFHLTKLKYQELIIPALIFYYNLLLKYYTYVAYMQKYLLNLVLFSYSCGAVCNIKY